MQQPVQHRRRDEGPRDEAARAHDVPIEMLAVHRDHGHDGQLPLLIVVGVVVGGGGGWVVGGAGCVVGVVLVGGRVVVVRGAAVEPGDAGGVVLRGGAPG